MKKVLIIGAGPAGITAGYELLRRSEDYEVTILEESDMIGGISRTVLYHGNRMDLGGHRFFSKSQEVVNWWNHLMPTQGSPAYDDIILGRNIVLPEKGPDPEKEDRVMLIRNRISRIYYKKNFFDYPVKINWNTIRNMGILTTINAGFSYFYRIFHKLEENSLENFYINRFGYKLYSMFFEAYTEKLWGRHPKEIPADWGAQRVKGLSVSMILKDIFLKLLPGKKSNRKVETSLIEEFYYPKYGVGQLWETAAEEFVSMGGKIEKNVKAAGFNIEKGKVVSVIVKSTKDMIDKEKVMAADFIVSSMPLKDLVLGMNDVPEKIKNIAVGLSYRDFVTVGLLIDRMNLQNKTKIKTLQNIVPDCWIYVQDTEVKLGRIQIFNNWSPYMVESPQDTVWIGLEYFCTEGDRYWNMSEEEWIEFGIKELMQMDIIRSKKNVLDGHCEKIKKAYPAYFDTYDQIDELRSYLNGFKNLFCIGRNGQHRYNNMDHSMLTAFETVQNIITGREKKDNIWNVNTEKEFHEEKSWKHLNGKNRK